MILTLIVFLLIVVFMAFFVGKNLTNVCTLWIFKTYTDLPVAVLVLIAFGAGIVFSVLCLVIYKLKHSEVVSHENAELKDKAAIKRAKAEEKMKKLQAKQAKKDKKSKNKPASEGSSDATIVADKPL